ncbi:phosphotransferase enzyme family protein [Rhodococcus sp. P1Y]|uniref:phosphotransferase enzyme family protein n=1 Tax=Rhodococcus sp. P1Y TaxID=1302308 RepID=UPI000EACD806|nr:phosphotransferase [Rhodococcus sp. P1Y]AYJ48008.1 aminoglycoside phosphotransferase [Rhodococcus sp. P1Y]
MLPVGLSMLWESVDPTDALRERFGFDSLDALSEWVSASLRKNWGIRSGECSRVVISDRNAIVWVSSDAGNLVVKWSCARDRFGALEASTALVRVCADHGVPVAAPIRTVDGLDRVIVDALSVTVQSELIGHWLDVTDHAAVFSAGARLADVHRALEGVHRNAAQPAVELRSRIEAWLADRDHGAAPDASRRLAESMSDVPDLGDDVQLVHNDFRAANILIRDSEVVGVLDFDEVVLGHRVNDLAKACTYLGTLFTDWGPTPSSVQQMLRAGYESVRPLRPEEARWFEPLLLWHGLLAIPCEDTAGWAAAL